MSGGAALWVIGVFSVVMLMIFGGTAFIVWRAYRVLREVQGRVKPILEKVNAIAGEAQTTAEQVTARARRVAEVAERTSEQVAGEVRETTTEVGQSVRTVSQVWRRALVAPVVEAEAALAGARRFFDVLIRRARGTGTADGAAGPPQESGAKPAGAADAPPAGPRR